MCGVDTRAEQSRALRDWSRAFLSVDSHSPEGAVNFPEGAGDFQAVQLSEYRSLQKLVEYMKGLTQNIYYVSFFSNQESLS